MLESIDPPTGCDLVSMQTTTDPRLAFATHCQALIAHETAAGRESIRKELLECPWIKPVAEAGTLKEAVQLFFSMRPALVIASINLPDGGGFDLVRTLKRSVADCQVILISRRHDTFVRRVGLIMGAVGVCSVAPGESQLQSTITSLGAALSGSNFLT